MDFLETMIARMNENIEGDRVTLGDFLHWIGLWVLMSTVNGMDQCSSWSTKEVNIFEGTWFRLTKFMM